MPDPYEQRHGSHVIHADPNNMFDTINTILDTMNKLLAMVGSKNVSAWRSKKRKRMLGVELFHIYTSLNEIIIRGEAIIESLKLYLQLMRHSMHVRGDLIKTNVDSRINGHIAVQVHNLFRFNHSVRRLAAELQLVDAENYRKLIALVLGKLSVIDEYLDLLYGQRLPLAGITLGDVESVIGNTPQDVLERGVPYDLLTKLRDGSLPPTSEPWGKDIYDRLREYMESRAPQKQLDGLKRVLTRMKKTLEIHFSTADILPDIGDNRLRSRYKSDRLF